MGIIKITDPIKSETQTVEIQEVSPTDSTKLNASIALSYDGSGNLQYIDKTIGSTVYRKTLIYSSNVLQSISSWVQQ